MLHGEVTGSGKVNSKFMGSIHPDMKRSIYFFLNLFLMMATSGMAQTMNPAADENHNAYPLIIALIILVVAIGTRLITVAQSQKRGNSI